MPEDEVSDLVARDPVSVVVANLREELDLAVLPSDVLKGAERAATAREAFKLIGRSVEECNRIAEVYLDAYWRFGDLVRSNPEGRPPKLGIDTQYPGTATQRKYARKFCTAISKRDLPDYVTKATEDREQATIEGAIEWANPSSRHGNLKGEYEWYTPGDVIEAARRVLGGIDLDPASCDGANDIVKATEFFTEEDDGLAQDWNGRVFLNPPFAHPTVKHFAEKLLESFHSGSVPQAVWLSNACVDVQWWQQLASIGAICFHLGRIKFYGPDGQLQPPTLGQSIIYLGDDKEAFKREFSPFGLVLA